MSGFSGATEAGVLHGYDVVNNLTSTATNQPLAAAQGRALCVDASEVINPVGGYFTKRDAFKATRAGTTLLIDSFINITTEIPANTTFANITMPVYMGKFLMVNSSTRQVYIVSLASNGSISSDSAVPTGYYFFIGAGIANLIQ